MPLLKSLAVYMAAVSAGPALPTVAWAAQPAVTEAPTAPAATAAAPTAAPAAAPTAEPPAPVATAPASTPVAAPATAPATAPAPAPAPTVAPDCSACQVTPPPRPSLPSDDGKGKIIAGACTLGTVYLLTAFGGAAMIDAGKKESGSADNPLTPEDESSPENSKAAIGRNLLIPVAGPFMAMRHTDSAKGRFGMAFGGALQITGAVLLTVGLVQRARYKQARRWGVVAQAGRDGGQVGFRMRF